MVLQMWKQKIIDIPLICQQFPTRDNTSLAAAQLISHAVGPDSITDSKGFNMMKGPHVARPAFPPPPFLLCKQNRFLGGLNAMFYLAQCMQQYSWGGVLA